MADKITSFTQLRSWQHAREFAVLIYKVTGEFPVTEKYGLTAQIRRSATSVAANIAEGFSRNGVKDKAHFYSIALGSLTETLSHAYISCDLEYLDVQNLQLLESNGVDLHKMINGLIKSVLRRNA